MVRWVKVTTESCTSAYALLHRGPTGPAQGADALLTTTHLLALLRRGSAVVGQGASRQQRRRALVCCMAAALAGGVWAPQDEAGGAVIPPKCCQAHWLVLGAVGVLKLEQSDRRRKVHC